MINEFFTSNETKWRLARTIVQAIISVIIGNLDIIFGTIIISDVWRPIVCALIMAILSPIMSEIGKKKEEE